MSGLDFDALVNGPCAAAFGVAATGGGLATFTMPDGTGFQLDGIFDEAWASVEPSSRHNIVPVSTTKPRFGARAAAFAVQPYQGCRLSLATGRTFEVADVNPDGFGWLYLVLTEV